MDHMGKEPELCVTTGGSAARLQARAATEQSFNSDKREAFLFALARTANVAMAARMTKVSESTVYRRRAKDPAFARDWRRAVAAGVIDLEIELLERARRGSETTIVRSDGSNEVRRAYSDRLAIFLVNRHAPITPEASAEQPEPAGRSAEEICVELERRIAAMNGAAE